MPENSVSKWIIIGVVVGLVIGGFTGFFISPSPDISGYEDQIEQLGSQATTLRDRVLALEEELGDQISIEEYSALELKIAQLQSDLEDAVPADEYATLENQFNELQYQVTSLQGEIDEKEDMIDELQRTISNLETLVPTPPPKEGEPGFSRFFPAEVGSTLTIAYEYLFDAYTATITLKEIIRGTRAWSMILDANMFNDPPPEGYEYILVKIKFEYVSGPTADTEYDLITSDFDAVSEDGYVYDSPYLVEPEPMIDACLYPGASHEGWGAYQVYSTDEKPVLAFGRGWSGTGGLWFKLYEES